MWRHIINVLNTEQAEHTTEYMLYITVSYSVRTRRLHSQLHNMEITNGIAEEMAAVKTHHDLLPA